MTGDQKIIFYKKHYQEIYSYIKMRVKTPEQAVEVTGETFTEFFKTWNEKNSEDIINIVKKIADKKCKKSRGKVFGKWLSVLGIAVFIVLLAMLIYWDASPKKNMKEALESFHEWDYKTGDEFAVHALFAISNYPSASDFINGGDPLSAYLSAGIGDLSLIKDGAVSGGEPDEKFYVAFIQVHNEEDIGQIISLMKQRVRPDKWFEEYHVNNWTDVSVDDFEFYVNRDCILITYVDLELVENGKIPSVKKMRANFDAVVELMQDK